MKKETAVEWLKDWMGKNQYFIGNDLLEAIEQAEAMEKEQIMKTARQCHFEGVRQSAKTSEGYIEYGEKYFNETYGGDK